MNLRSATAGLISLAIAFLAPEMAFAGNPFIVVRDDGGLAQPDGDLNQVRNRLAMLYLQSGAPLPNVISVWTSFPMRGNIIETLFLPVSNDVKGIGLEQFYGGDGIIESTLPLRGILLHNDVTQLERRARFQQAPLGGFADYIFMLELSHLWGPALKLPGDPLIGFPFHWSFFLDAGGPAGGNAWTDGGDGTFTVKGQHPTTLRYSMLDLYVMGLAEPSEVKPFGVLEDVTVPEDVLDPFSGRPFTKASFPWWGEAPLTVTAKRREFTIADVVAANGPRVPDAKHAPKTVTAGIMLVVGKEQTDQEIATAKQALSPVARSIAASFREATQGRGTLDVVTEPPDESASGESEGEVSSGLGTDDGVHEGASSDERVGSGCSLAGASARDSWWLCLVGASLLVRRRRTAAA